MDNLYSNEQQSNRLPVNGNATARRPSPPSVYLDDNRPTTVQKKSLHNDLRPGALIQAKLNKQFVSPIGNIPVQRQESSLPKQNQTGLPDNLKSGIEALSGHSMDDVKVHYNSSKPATLQAHAYARGTDIHLARGQEKHLPHEAWHVAQQKQGKVQPTLQIKKVAVNDDSGLEREADVMGVKALTTSKNNQDIGRYELGNKAAGVVPKTDVIQCKLPPNLPDTNGFYQANKDTDSMEMYVGGKPTKFSTQFKENCLKAWGGVYDNDYKIWHIFIGHGAAVVLPSNAIQIDHVKSWATIEKQLLNFAPKRLRSTDYADSEGNYTIYAARMYYHDFQNLRPMAPSDNASKGSRNDKSDMQIDAENQNAMQNLHLWTNQVNNCALKAHDNAKLKKYPEPDLENISTSLLDLEGPLFSAYTVLNEIVNS